jgi:hypothetical protein
VSVRQRLEVQALLPRRDRTRERLASATAAAWGGDAPEPEGEERELTLIVETPAGVLVRRVPNAMGLRTDVERGEAAEEAVHDSAAIWGCPTSSTAAVSSPLVPAHARSATT